MVINRPTLTANPYRRDELIRYGHILADMIGERPDAPAAVKRSVDAERTSPGLEKALIGR